MAVRVVDLFSGAGGTSCGLRLAGMLPIAAVDIDAGALETYAANFPDATTIAADIRTVEVRRLLDVVDLAGRGDGLLLAAWNVDTPQGVTASSNERVTLGKRFATL